jgi:transcriptional regulator with XRE-family HTH domain
MAEYQKREPTPVEIAKFGHVAARLRQAIDSDQLTLAEMSRITGYSYAAAWQWANCRGAPNQEAAELLAKALGCRTEDLRPHTDTEAPPAMPKIRDYTPVTTRDTPLAEVFRFTVMSDGSTRIKLDATLPLEAAKPLIRMIFDASDLLPRSNSL